jgi:hypothetical protein
VAGVVSRSCGIRSRRVRATRDPPASQPVSFDLTRARAPALTCESPSLAYLRLRVRVFDGCRGRGRRRAADDGGGVAVADSGGGGGDAGCGTSTDRAVHGRERARRADRVTCPGSAEQLEVNNNGLRAFPRDANPTPNRRQIGVRAPRGSLDGDPSKSDDSPARARDSKSVAGAQEPLTASGWPKLAAGSAS